MFSYGHYVQHATRIWPFASDSLPFIQRPGSYCAKPTGIQPGCLVRFWPNTSESEASWCARLIRPCYQYPTFRLGCILLQTAWIILSKTSPDQFCKSEEEFWLTVSGFHWTDPVRNQHCIYHCEALRAHLKVRCLTNVHINRNELGGSDFHFKKKKDGRRKVHAGNDSFTIQPSP